MPPRYRRRVSTFETCRARIDGTEMWVVIQAVCTESRVEMTETTVSAFSIRISVHQRSRRHFPRYFCTSPFGGASAAKFPAAQSADDHDVSNHESASELKCERGRVFLRYSQICLPVSAPTQPASQNRRFSMQACGQMENSGDFAIGTHQRMHGATIVFRQPDGFAALLRRGCTSLLITLRLQGIRVR